MLTPLVVMLALNAAPADKPKEEATEKELFAKEDWYKDEKGKEETFVGTLDKVDQGGRVGIGRFNPYRLKMEKETREIYVGGKTDILDAFKGKKVKITGKSVMMDLEGKKSIEIWPAKIEIVKEKTGLDGDRGALVALADDKELKIAATAFWRPQGGAKGEAQQVVIRTGEDAAKATGMKDADEATKELAKQFKVDAIDWKKQMVVVVTAGPKPTGGYAVTINKLTVADKSLTVKWTLKSPGKGDIVTQAFTHPAQAILTDAFEGEVKFDPPAAKGDKNRE